MEHTAMENTEMLETVNNLIYDVWIDKKKKESINRKLRILARAGLFVEPEFKYRGVVFNKKAKAK